jgi:hypothetical protein
VAELVEVGARFAMPERARLGSAFLPTMASTRGCVLVMQCIVVIDPCTMPRFSLMTLIGGAMQFVVPRVPTAGHVRHQL